MKKILLFFFTFFLLQHCFAQDPAYTGPAKIYVKSFWSNMEKLKNGTATASTINNADRAIRNIKENDPAYNTSAMEEVLKPFREKAEKEKADSENEKEKKKAEADYFKTTWGKFLSIYSSGTNINGMATGTEFYNAVKELNLEEYKQKKNELNGKENSYAKEIDQILADYDAFIVRTDMVKWVIVPLMNHAKDATTPTDKNKYYTEAQKQCEALLMLTNNETVKQKLNDINKLLGNATAATAKFFTSDYHKEHLNQIVWSSSPLIIGKEREMSAMIKNEFKSGETIYGTVYLGRNVRDAQNSNARLPIKIKIDNNTYVWGGDLSNIAVTTAMQEKSYLQFALLPDEKWIAVNFKPYIEDENWTITYFLEDLVRSGDINHDIKVTLDFAGYGAEIISSQLKLDLNNGIENIKKLAVNSRNSLMANRQLPKPAMNNAGLEQQMMNVLKNQGWSETFQKVIITSSGWTINKNQLTGAILYRYIGAVGVSKNADGTCAYQQFTFSNEYTGGGNYSNTLKLNSIGNKKEIGCDKVK